MDLESGATDFFLGVIFENISGLVFVSLFFRFKRNVTVFLVLKSGATGFICAHTHTYMCSQSIHGYGSMYALIHTYLCAHTHVYMYAMDVNV